jgi:hypothetical protein
MIIATEKSVKPASSKNPNIQVLSRKFGTLQSSYSQAINNELKRKGSLFQQKTKSKSLHENITDKNAWNGRTGCLKPLYINTCFYYIHQNPIEAKLVNKNEDWQFSSFLDYCDMRDGTMCNKKLANEILDIDFDNYYYAFNKKLADDNLKNIW